MTRVEAPPGVDHLIYAVPNLEAGIDDVERLLGVRPAVGGRHPQYGTRNALVGLGPETYLEIMAPDPGLPRPERGRLFGLDRAEPARLATWVLRCEEIDAAHARALGAGVAIGQVDAGRREQPDGTELSWRLTDPYAMPLDGLVPFLIAWGDTPHPADAAPRGGELVGLRLEHPESAAVRGALRALDVEVVVGERPAPRIIATIKTSSGPVEIG